MATQLIGDTTWTRIPGDKETNGEDGSITVVRFYNGAITGGTNGTGEASWQAFKASHPIGSADPDYGTAVRSVALPMITRSGKATYTASITFKGGNYETEGGTATTPSVSVSKVARTIEAEHPDASIAWETVTCTYKAWQTVASYIKQGPPSDDGLMSGYAKDAAVPINTLEIDQGPLPTGATDKMNDTQLQAALTQGELFLEDLSFTRRSGESGNVIYDVTEIWIRGLDNA